jgi:hypothetical protein
MECVRILLAQTVLNFQHFWSIVLCWSIVIATLFQFQIVYGVSNSVADVFIISLMTYCSITHCQAKKKHYILLQEKMVSDKLTVQLKADSDVKELRVADMRWATGHMIRSLS